MSLLTIVQNAADIIGVDRPASVVSNADPQLRTMHALLNRAGRNLVKLRNTWGGGWSVLEREHIFTTVGGQAEYDLPFDFGELIADTVWDRSNFFEARGPLSPQLWQQVKSGLLASAALRKRYRIKRSSTGMIKKFFIDPTPQASGEELVIEYLSERWVRDQAGSELRTGFEADDDIALLDEDLLEMDLIWRFKQAKGLSYAAEIAEFEMERDKRMANDGGTTKINLTPRRFHLPRGNVPETGFGGES